MHLPPSAWYRTEGFKDAVQSAARLYLDNSANWVWKQTQRSLAADLTESRDVDAIKDRPSDQIITVGVLTFFFAKAWWLETFCIAKNMILISESIVAIATNENLILPEDGMKEVINCTRL